MFTARIELIGAVLLMGGTGFGQTTELASLKTAGTQGNEDCFEPAISPDGRYVAFATNNNMVPGGANGEVDVFVRDRQAGTTELVSVSSSGSLGNAHSHAPSISADGRFVAFDSGATNLIPDDTNTFQDVFVHDRQTGATECVSVDSSGNQGNGNSPNPAISADGRFVAFESWASNLVPGDTNGQTDIFVHDRETGTTERVSVDSSGNQGDHFSYYPSISSDGRYVAFHSGSSLALEDTSWLTDVFVHDRLTATTELVSVDSSGNQADSHSREASISGDGRYVAFWSGAENLVAGGSNGFQVFVHDRETGATEQVSVATSGQEGNSASYEPFISGDGRFVAFWSSASNLVPDDTNDRDDAFVHDRETGATERVSVDSSGAQGDGHSGEASISEDGRSVAFWSRSTNLVPLDTNEEDDIFVRDRGCGSGGLRYCTAGTSASGCTAEISAAGAASATALSGFVVTASGLEGQKDGLFFYGQNGLQANPWGNGTSYQCVVPPTKRGGLQAGNGTVGLCDGVISQDLNALWCPSCPHPGQAPTLGKIQIQFWYRDPQSTSNQKTSLSDALEVDVCP